MLFGEPPVKSRGTCTAREGYWVKVAKSISGNSKVSFLFVKSVYSKWVKNHDDIQRRVHNLLDGKSETENCNCTTKIIT